MGRVPTSLKVLGILGIIFSSLFLLFTPCGLIMMYHPIMPNPMTDRLYQNGTFVGFSLASGTLGCFLAMLLLASSIGCLKAKRWARTGMNTYAVIYSIFKLVALICSFIFITPIMKEVNDAMPPGPGKMPPEFFQTTQMIGAIFGIVWTATVALTVLILANRRIAVDAFNGIFPADPTDFPVDYPPPLPPQ